MIIKIRNIERRYNRRFAQNLRTDTGIDWQGIDISDIIFEGMYSFELNKERKHHGGKGRFIQRIESNV